MDVASGRKNRLYPEWIRHRAAESDVSQITRRRHNGGIPQQFPQRTGKIDRYCCRKDGEKTGYGEKSPDGKRCIKNQELRDAFAQTEAYSDLFMELATDAEAAARFINGIVPQGKKAPAPRA